MMKAVSPITCCIVLAGLGFVTSAWSATPKVEFSNPPAEVETYDFAEIVIRVSDLDMANPFTDASVEGHFAQQGSEPVAVDGFCDSADGSVFRIRFMPSRPGRHEYSITYRQQGLERTQTGSFNAVASGRKGLLRLDPANRLHFIWEGTGKHYFWNGTTTYYLMGWDDETIRQSIDRLHRLKINRLRVLVYGRNEPRPWGQPVVPTENFQLHLKPWVAERPDDIKNPSFDLKRFNVDHWRKYERLLRHAREKDVIISVIFFIGGQVLPRPFEADSEEERLYYRYAVTRLAAFSNVTWDLGNEYNLFAGSISSRPDKRVTPYHPAHSTEIAGESDITGGDNRFYNNIFIGSEEQKHGLSVYDNKELPLQTGGNVYLNGARPYAKEVNPLVLAGIDPGLKLVEEDGRTLIQFDGFPELDNASTALVTTALLGRARIPELPFENPDGSALAVDTDYLGRPRSREQPSPGPFEKPGRGTVSLPVWEPEQEATKF